ncbi:DNA-binding response regulator [Actinomyces sp. 2119]|uniref:DNA-binding response regulator n=1 Tax=Actinomyces lilanjuaniae TaxID=2321394 RepID=A0ABN5PQA0_9ACTO|nr:MULTISPECIES: response regulator transcription factor [Actinomyces]AYD89224.1 DNA-binding response regulator [Actinomyces lilanjuaniae]RJF41973.1 DNA-binding response regulator [Actinomyces sp. 2119]
MPASGSPPPVRTPGKMIRVVAVDDDQFVLGALRSYLSAAEGIEVLSTFTIATDALAFMSRMPVDVLITDIRMLPVDGLELLARVKARYPDTAVLVLTSFDDDSAMIEALSQQASGFLLKDADPEEVVQAVRAASTGGTTISPRATSRLISEGYLREARVPARPDLTGAEREVLTLLCEGYSNAEIADRLVVAESTVKTHVSSLMRKYGVTSRLKLVVAVHQEEAGGSGG